MIDVHAKRLDLAGRRGRAGPPPRRLDAAPPRYTTGVLAKYARLVSGAERGAITNPI